MTQQRYDEPRKPGAADLRRGFTTGATAAAAAKSACSALLGYGFLDPVTVRLPRGGEARFELIEATERRGVATATIRKDAGDDPDVTHGALIEVSVRSAEARGVRFAAGPGVGTVTKPGLPIPPGEPAINPVPRRMIEEALAEVAGRAGAPLAFEVEVAVPGGEEIALKTLNPRLGIVGGISILGTTGVVVPFSCSSWIHSIHRGIDVARATGLTHLGAATGSTSELALRNLRGLPEHAMLDMGDFAGGTLKYLRRHPVPRLSLAGGFAKMTKLAQGHLDLHSARSSVDLANLAAAALDAGASRKLAGRIETANTAAEALAHAQEDGLDLAGMIAQQAQRVAAKAAGPEVAIEAVVVDRQGVVVASAPW